VSLLKSLFCLQGFDNRSRFFIICCSTFIGYIMLSNALTGQLFVSLILLSVFTLILALTTSRRLHDAKLSKNWIIAPSLTFVISGIIIILTKHNSSYWLLIIPALCAALLLTYQSKGKHSYILGYYGPIDLSEYQNQTANAHINRQRIEPKLSTNSHSEHAAINFSNEDPSLHSHTINNFAEKEKNNKHFDIGEMIRLKLLGKKNARITIMASVGIAIIAVLISLLNSIFADKDTPLKLTEKVTPIVSIRTNLLTMPDNFSLYSSQYNGIIVHWQADKVETSQLWSQLSIKGDKSCKVIHFNKGDDIRTLSVFIENGIDYYANFSPLDSKKLIQSLAFRGSFSLCGYDFSLKGSQAALGKNQFYADLVEY